MQTSNAFSDLQMSLTSQLDLVQSLSIQFSSFVYPFSQFPVQLFLTLSSHPVQLLQP